MICCNKILRLDDVNVCDLVIKIPVTASVNGEYKLILNFLEHYLLLTQTLAIGDALNFEFTSGRVNENFTYTGYIKNPAGDVVGIVKDGTTYNCIQFGTKLFY